MAKSVHDRFFTKIDARGPCWEWTAATMKSGYGVFNLGSGKGTVLAHRLSYELLVGAIPEGRQLDHLCRNRRCVDPDHLEVVSQDENLRRGYGPSGANIRKRTCPRDHPYNAKYKARGKQVRVCTVCRRPERPERNSEADKRGRGAKISMAQAREIRGRFASESISKAELGRQYGISPWRVTEIINNKGWRERA